MFGFFSSRELCIVVLFKKKLVCRYVDTLKEYPRIRNLYDNGPHASSTQISFKDQSKALLMSRDQSKTVVHEET